MTHLQAIANISYSLSDLQPVGGGDRQLSPSFCPPRKDQLVVNLLIITNLSNSGSTGYF